MVDLAAAVAKLDAGVDSYLGDPLFYDVAGVLAEKPVKGFIEDPSEFGIQNLDGQLDSVGIRRRVEISRQIVPNPAKADRIRSDHALLAGAVWKVAKWRTCRGARNWMLELERL